MLLERPDKPVQEANRTHDKLEAEGADILRQAAAADYHQDRLFGDARGDKLPLELASKADRLAREQAYQQRVAAHTTAAAAKGRTPRTLKRRPQETPNPEATANVTDPDSRFLHTRNGTVQGYNAQAVTTLELVIVAAELTDEANDVHQLKAMPPPWPPPASTTDLRRCWPTPATPNPDHESAIWSAFSPSHARQTPQDPTQH